jgi:hypothetical protein
MRVEHHIRHDPAHRFAQHGLAVTGAHQMPRRDRIGEVEQSAIEERRTVLDRVVHGVEIILVQDDRHGFLE